MKRTSHQNHKGRGLSGICRTTGGGSENQKDQEVDGYTVRCAFDRLVAVAELKPHPRNPNTHPESQVALLAKVIGKSGWRNPIVVSTRSGFVVKGHGRLLAAKRMGLARVPVDFQTYTSKADEFADMVADNHLADLAEIDRESLASVLKELQGEKDFDLELAGFDTSDVDALLAGLDEDDPSDRPAREITCPACDHVFTP